MTRYDLAAERITLELTVAETFKTLRATPAFKAYEAAEFRLIEHRVLYGTGDLTAEPRGLLHAFAVALGDACTLCDIALDATNRDPHYPHLCRACNADIDEAGAALPDEFPNDDDSCDFDDEVVT